MGKYGEISQEIGRQGTEEIEDLRMRRCGKEFHGDGEEKSAANKV